MVAVIIAIQFAQKIALMTILECIFKLLIRC